jgi:hypothetical protein
LLCLVNQHRPVVAVVSMEEVSVVVSAAVALVLAVFAAALWLPNTLEAEPGAAVVALALALPVLAAFAETDFAQPRIRMGALILPVEVSADQRMRSDTTTEAPARLLLGHTNSADGETDRRDRMPAGTQPLLASKAVRHHQQGKT